MKTAQEGLAALKAHIPAGSPAEFEAFLDLHRMILNDSALAQAPRELIRKRRANAEWALVQQMERLVERFEEIDDPYLRERKADVQQAVERVLAALMGGQTLDRAGAVGGGEADRGGARPLARRHDPVQEAPLRRLRHRRRRRHLAHRDRRALARHPGDRRPAPCAADDQRGRDADRRRHARPADRQPRPDRARGVPRAAGRAQGGAQAPAAPEVHARGDGRRHADRAVRQHRAAGGHAGGARGRRRGRGTVPHRVHVPQPQGAAGRGGAVRGLPRSGQGDEGPAGGAAHARSGRRQGAERQRRSGRTKPNPAMGLRAIRFCLSEPQMFLTQLRAILRASNTARCGSFCRCSPTRTRSTRPSR